MAIAPYDPAALGPSQEAGMAQLADQQQAQKSRAQSDYGLQLGYSNDIFNTNTLPQLKSSIGATGQYYSTARQGAVDTAIAGHKMANAGLHSTFQRTMDDMQRQAIYASMGLIL